MAARSSAAARREQVLDAAVAEFAAKGYHGASTGAIARRAGISQPYVYALYASKRDLFLAAHRHAAAHVRDRLVAAAGAAGAEPAARLRAMSDAFFALARDRTEVLCQLQAYAAAGDPVVRADVRGEFLATLDAVERASGAGRAESAFFLASAAYLTIATALDVAPEAIAD